MITVVQEKCSQCGLCVDICHCLTFDGEALKINYQECSTCTHCIAVCPTRAIAWDHTVPLAFNRKNLPTPEQLDELFKERRSIRRFKRDKIERSLLEEIASYGIYAPAHSYSLRAIIVDDEMLIAVMDQAILNTCRWLDQLVLRNNLIITFGNWLGFGNELTKTRPKIEAALRQGHAFSSMPTAFILVVGDRKIPLSDASAQYALANMMFYAQARGVGTCLWANGPLFIDKHKLSRRKLGLKKNERIFGALYMGYPAIKFSNKVIGKTFPIQWNGEVTKSLA